MPRPPALQLKMVFFISIGLTLVAFTEAMVTEHQGLEVAESKLLRDTARPFIALLVWNGVSIIGFISWQAYTVFQLASGELQPATTSCPFVPL